MSTLDSWFHIFEVQETKPAVKHSFQTDYCVCQYFWSRNKNVFYLGTLAGDILELDLGKSETKVCKKYEEKSPVRP